MIFHPDGRRRNLVIIHRGPEYQQDFDEIAEKVTERDPLITVYHMPHGLDASLPLSAWQYPTLTAPDAEIEAGEFAPKQDRSYSFAADEDILALARTAARAFPEVPLLGIDILRDTRGRLFVIETNAGGNVWHYSSKVWEADRLAHPEYYAEMRSQFGAFDIAARRLCEVVRARAA